MQAAPWAGGGVRQSVMRRVGVGSRRGLERKRGATSQFDDDGLADRLRGACDYADEAVLSHPNTFSSSASLLLSPILESRCCVASPAAFAIWPGGGGVGTHQLAIRAIRRAILRCRF